jgi:hypothetical protein
MSHDECQRPAKAMNTADRLQGAARALRRGVLAVCATLAACASTDQAKVTDAATAPLADFNLVQAEIPPVLLQAQKQPYKVPTDSGCPTLNAEIADLDAVLGADLDAPPGDDKPTLLERGGTEAKNSAIGALRRTTEGVVPFRGWIRKLTGAERYSKKVAAAITAGTARRAFLKGLRASAQCSSASSETKVLLN